MSVLGILIPVSLMLGAAGLLGFVWTVRHRQYDDPAGDAHRILSGRYDDMPRDD